MRLLIDTGSSNLWLLSSYLPQEGRVAHNYYNQSSSPTFQLLDGVQFNLTYYKDDRTTFAASGYTGTDSVDIGGAFAAKMLIGVADVVGRQWLDQDLDGVLGLEDFGLAYVGKYWCGTFMQFVQPFLSAPVFTCNFRNGTTGTIEFGHVDEKLYSGTLTSVHIDNMTTASSWVVQDVLFSSGGRDLSSKAQPMHFDTTSTTTLANADVVKAYWTQVSGAQDLSGGRGKFWVFPCNITLPDLSLHFATTRGGNSTPIVISGSYLNAGSIGLEWNKCRGGLNAVKWSDSGTDGAAFYKSQFVVYNQAEPSISFAPHNTAWVYSEPVPAPGGTNSSVSAAVGSYAGITAEGAGMWIVMWFGIYTLLYMGL